MTGSDLGRQKNGWQVQHGYSHRYRPLRLSEMPSSQGAAAQFPLLSVLSRPSTRDKKDLRTGCADRPAFSGQPIIVGLLHSIAGNPLANTSKHKTNQMNSQPCDQVL